MRISCIQMDMRLGDSDYNFAHAEELIRAAVKAEHPDTVVLPETWIGKSLEELNVRRNHGVNVIGLREGDDVDVTPDPKKPLKRDMILILIGANADLKKFAKYEKNE